MALIKEKGVGLTVGDLHKAQTTQPVVVKILKDYRVALDGVTTSRFKKGDSAKLPLAHAQMLVDAEVGEIVGAAAKAGKGAGSDSAKALEARVAELMELTGPQLRAKCEELELEVASNANKAALAEAIAKAEAQEEE